MKDWEKYEEQIFKKLNESFPNSNILKNQKIKGKYSERSRQIDILVVSESVGYDLIIVIDCKKFNKKIDVKAVESFIGFSEDVGAHIGVLITNVGFTKSAHKRAINHHKSIKLDIIEFENFDDYNFIYDSCDLCRDNEGDIRGLISFSDSIPLIVDKTVALINSGECSYCGESYVKCQGCGDIIHIDIDSDDYECNCGNIFYIKSEYIGSGMTEETLSVRKQNDEIPEFKDPNQTKLFE